MVGIRVLLMLLLCQYTLAKGIALKRQLLALKSDILPVKVAEIISIDWIEISGRDRSVAEIMNQYHKSLCIYTSKTPLEVRLIDFQ